MSMRSLLVAAALLAASAVASGAASDAKPLWRAARKNDAAAISALITAGVDINAVDGNGRSALWLAAEAGNLDALERLLTLGADLSLRDRKGRTAADAALGEGYRSSYDRLAFESAARANTLESYAAFLASHPGDGPLRARAYRSMEEIQWQEAVRANSIDKLRQFKRAYPANTHSAQVDALVEAIEWQSLQPPAQASIEGLRRFNQAYPNSSHAAEARQRIDALLTEQANAARRRSAQSIQRVRTSSSRAAQPWFDGLDITVTDFLPCALGATGCVSNMRYRSHTAGPKPGNVFLIVEADLVPWEDGTVKPEEIVALRTGDGTPVPPFIWYPSPGSAGWTSGGLAESLTKGKQQTLRWLYELPGDALADAQLEIWGRPFGVLSSR